MDCHWYRCGLPFYLGLIWGRWWGSIKTGRRSISLSSRNWSYFAAPIVKKIMWLVYSVAFFKDFLVFGAFLRCSLIHAIYTSEEIRIKSISFEFPAFLPFLKSQFETQFSRQNESVKTNNHEKEFQDWDERNETISKESRGNGQEFRSFVQRRRTCEDQRGHTWLSHFRYHLSHFALHLVLFRWLVLCHPVCALLLLLSGWSWTITLSLWMHPRKV